MTSIPRTLPGRAWRYWQTFGPRKTVRRLGEVGGGYVLGAAAPLFAASRALPAGSVPSAEGLPEIVFLGGIEWNLRFQRPQQLSLALARAGCRVHYCAPSTIASWGEGWRMRPLTGDGRVWHTCFLGPKRLSLNDMADGDASTAAIARSLQRLVDAVSGRRVVAVVEHPFWIPVLESLTGASIIYDCLDDFSDFAHAHPRTREREARLAGLADALVTTASHLAAKWAECPLPQAVIRNACEPEHFARRPPDVYPVPHGPVIGYHGAIEEWFDPDLVELTARSLPHCTVLLVGGGSPDITTRLGKLPNVVLTGEVPYANLPRYVHAFDVAILPFRIQPLTLGTNPVKVYEYLAAGLPVVGVPLPEMAQFGDLVRTGQGGDFVSAVEEALADRGDAKTRREFARANTWDARAEALLALMARI